MPNWCSTSYIFESTNRDVLKRFYDFVIKYTSDGYAIVMNGDSPFTLGNMWLGNLLHGCKVEFGATDKDIENIPCRGGITYLFTNKDNEGYIFERDCFVDDNVYYLKLDTDTAWCIMNEIWDFILEYFPDINYYYQATEYGCGIYETNDIEHEYFEEDYHVYITIDIQKYPELKSFTDAFKDYYYDDEIIEGSFSTKDLFSLLEQALKLDETEYNDIDDLISITFALFEDKDSCRFNIDMYTESEEYY